MTNRKSSSQIEWLLTAGLFLTIGMPFLVGYGVMPLTNFGAEVVAVVGLGVLWLSALTLTSIGQTASDRVKSAVVAIPIGLAFWVLFKAWLLHPGDLNWSNLAVYLGYLLAAAGAIWVGLRLSEAIPEHKLLQMVAGVLLVGGAMAALGSYLQYFQVNASWLTLSPSSDPGRTYGFIRQANHQATFLCMSVACLLSWRSRRTDTPWIWWVIFVFLSWAILTTGSRAGLVQMAVILLLFAWATWKSPAQMSTTLVACALLLILGWGLFYGADRWLGVSFYGVEKLTQSQTEGIGVRQSLWQSSWELIVDQPWWGYPVHAFRSAFVLQGHVLDTQVALENAHNLLLQAAFEWGLPVAVGLHLAILAWLVKMFRRLRTSPLILLSTALVVCVLVHSQFEYPLWYSYFLFPAAIFLGISLGPGSEPVVSLKGAGPDRAQVSRTPVSAVLWALLPLTVILAGLSANRDFYRLTPLFLNQQPEMLAQRFIDADQVFWFRQYRDLPQYIRAGRDHPAPHPGRMDELAFLGCSLPEPWYQPASLLALAEAGYVNDAKWIAYLLIKLNPKNQQVLQAALDAEQGDWVHPLRAYVERPLPMEPSSLFFIQSCVR